VVVRNTPAGPVVAGVRKNVEGVREGDIVLRFNGAPVRTAREFNRYVADSRPGSTAELEVRRDGVVRRVALWVRQLDVMPRG
jgi:serine protease Do